jgi:hypothetical protein
MERDEPRRVRAFAELYALMRLYVDLDDGLRMFRDCAQSESVGSNRYACGITGRENTFAES